MRKLLVFVFFVFFWSPSYAANCAGKKFESEYLLKSPVCIPAKPKRIIVLDPTLTLGTAIDLDLPVIAAPMLRMSDKELAKRAHEKGVVDIGYFAEPKLEKIIKLKPDLIIGSAYLGDGVYNMVSQLAPTIFLTVTDWKIYTSVIAKATGKEEVAKKEFAKYDKRIGNIKANMPDKKVSIIRITNWDFQVYLDAEKTYAPFKIIREAGVKRTPYETRKPTDPETSLKRPDWEEIGALEGDILLYIIGGANNSDISGRYEEVIGNPLWKLLPAVQSGEVHRIDAGIWMEFSGFTAAHRVLDDVEKYILKR